MTDPSPDCGYTDAEQAPADGLRSAIAVYVAVVADEDASESAVLEADQALAEQIQRTDQAWDEVARLREFGEHYSGAAQDAWDRIVVLEKALREIEKRGTHRRHDARPYDALTKEAQIARDALAAGSASPDACEHEWVDARNEVIESGVMCPKCGTFAAASPRRSRMNHAPLIVYAARYALGRQTGAPDDVLVAIKVYKDDLQRDRGCLQALRRDIRAHLDVVPTARFSREAEWVEALELLDALAAAPVSTETTP